MGAHDLKAILDSFIPYVKAVLKDTASNREHDVESIRRRPFRWSGELITTVTSAKPGVLIDSYRLTVSFECAEDRQLDFFTTYPELRKELEETLKQGYPTEHWRLQEEQTRISGDSLTLLVM